MTDKKAFHFSINVFKAHSEAQLEVQIKTSIDIQHVSILLSCKFSLLFSRTWGPEKSPDPNPDLEIRKIRWSSEVTLSNQRTYWLRTESHNRRTEHVPRQITDLSKEHHGVKSRWGAWQGNDLLTIFWTHWSISSPWKVIKQTLAPNDMIKIGSARHHL